MFYGAHVRWAPKTLKNITDLFFDDFLLTLKIFCQNIFLSKDHVTSPNFSVAQMWNQRTFKNQNELDKEFGPILLNIELFFVIYLCDFRAGAFDRWLYNGLKSFHKKHSYMD